MKKFIFSLVVSLQISICFSQKVELGNVTIDELNEKQYPKDTTAVAAFLFKRAKTIFEYKEDKGFISSTEFSIKLKIYKTEGLKWANFEIPYYIGYNKIDDESVEVTKAYTYNIENNKIERDKLKSEGKYNKKINEFWATKVITFPNVKVGSVIEFKYVLKTENLSNLPEFQFQYEIPVTFAEYQANIPEFYIYKGIKNGFVDIQKREELENTSQSYSSSFGKHMTLNYRQIKTNYFAANIPKLTAEKFVNNIENYYGKIENELQIVRMPDQNPKHIATTWEDVAKSIYKEKEFGEELQKNRYFSEDLRKLIDSNDTDLAKLNKVYSFIKNRMNWNGKYGYYVSKGVEIAYNEKTGNVAEINLMLVSMLNLAGIKSSPVLISTRDNGIALFPNRSKFNYVIAIAHIGESKFLLDATNKFSLPNILPLRDLNWVGRSIEKDGTSEEVDLMPTALSKQIATLSYKIDENGKVSGNVRKSYFDYFALEFRQNKSGINQDSYIEKLEKNTIEIIDYSRKNENIEGMPIEENYSFTENKSVEVINNKLYFSPLLFFVEKENPFKQDTRKYPVDFDYPKENKFTISIEIPTGYQVESLPQSITINSGDNICSYKFLISNTENRIQTSIAWNVNQALVSANQFDLLKKFYQQMIEKQTEKIILKKI